MIRVATLLFLGAALVAGIDNLTPPTNLMSEVTSTAVMLTWDELENVTFQVRLCINQYGVFPKSNVVVFSKNY